MEGVPEINLTVNGTGYRVLNADPKMRLIEWLRSNLHLTGTKSLCKEGGCGSCVVSLSKEDPSKKPECIMAVNSCLLPLMSLDGYHIITVEGLGGQKEGFHVIQKRFAENFASQCGFCTPGFVMSGFSCLASDANGRSKKEIEESLDGNICRCTGYRPILDAMKLFSKDSENVVDIEDLRRICVQSCKNLKPQIMDLAKDNHSATPWFKPVCLTDLYQIMKQFRDKCLKFVAGNTDVFKDQHSVDAYINLAGLGELNSTETEKSSVKIGSGVTLSKTIRFLDAESEKSSSFSVIAEHLKNVANLPVRNVATWAGNLMMTHTHRFFPSDIMIIFETVGATLSITDMDGCIKEYNIQEFLNADMKSKVILSVSLPFTPNDVFTKTYKIMPRSQNTYAYVNAGFQAAFDESCSTFKKRPTILFGGLGLKRARSHNVEEFLTGKQLDNGLFQDAVKILEKDLETYQGDKFVDRKYCIRVAINLFYKFCVSLRAADACKRSLNAIESFEHHVSSGKQSFNVAAGTAPLNRPYQRIEGKLQASGQVAYVGDLPKYQTEAYASLVLSEKGNAKLENICSAEASKHPGFIDIFSCKDIPGPNNCVLEPYFEEIFVSKNIEYVGQAVAIVIADTQVHADEIAKMVKIEYSDVKKPVTSLQEAIEKEMFFPKTFPDKIIGDTEEAFKLCDHVITGEVEAGSQHHFYIEPQTCLVVPEQLGYKIFSSSQNADLLQQIVSRALSITASSVDVEVPRVGGAFGGKNDYPALYATAVTVAVNELNRPVRMTLSLSDNLKTAGKRCALIAKYKVGFSKEGCLQACDIQLYCDTGNIDKTVDGILALSYLDNAYFCPNWNISVINCKTNTPYNTHVRAPGIVTGIFAMESIIEHVASHMGKPNVEDIREINFYKDGQTSKNGILLSNPLLHDVWRKIKFESEYERRTAELAVFNQEHRWKKRGIALTPLKYDVGYYNFKFTALVSIYYADGTVAISQGGVEMGQGIHTRVCQVASAKLGVPMDMISVKPMSTITSPNSSESGGSITSELNCLAILKCAEILLERIAPIRAKFPTASWKELIHECGEARVDLSANHMICLQEKANHAYSSYGAACSEVEVDVLTGETHILRSDIILDCGESINQRLDVGQVEGGFVMGIGFFLTEKIDYDSDTGYPLSTSTWNYSPPMSKDIPNDMRVYLLSDVPNPIKFLRSKAVGELAICMASSCLFAVKRAIEAARAELGLPGGYFALDAPATIDKVQSLCLVEPQHLVI